MNIGADPPFSLPFEREPFGAGLEYQCRSAFLPRPLEREPSGAGLAYRCRSAFPPLPLGEGRGEGQRVPFFESHHNHRTPLFPFSPRRLN
ncbi:hypothetical protein BMD99_003290 [Klebsiella sp. PO552]|nr:hypothetical protein BMD99_003290 [Klebsiella sp. PO552]